MFIFDHRCIETLNKVKNEIHDIRADVKINKEYSTGEKTYWKDLLEGIKANQDKLQSLIMGNGRPGILTRIEILESKLDTPNGRIGILETRFQNLEKGIEDFEHYITNDLKEARRDVKELFDKQEASVKDLMKELNQTSSTVLVNKTKLIMIVASIAILTSGLMGFLFRMFAKSL